MSASPELYRPAEAPAFSPSCATQPPLPLVFAGDDYCCRTPTGSGICYLREPTTCPPAPRKPPPPPPMCRKRLFQAADQQVAEAGPVPVISIRLDELERLFRPCPPPTTTTTTDKRRRSGSGPSPSPRSATKHAKTLDIEAEGEQVRDAPWPVSVQGASIIELATNRASRQATSISSSSTIHHDENISIRLATG